MDRLEYQVTVLPLKPADGGGFLAYVPDLPGCMSDGDTPEEAITNVRSAIDEWKDQCVAMGRPVPQPSRQREFA